MTEDQKEITRLRAENALLLHDLKVRDYMIARLSEQLMKYDLGDVELIPDDQKRAL